MDPRARLQEALAEALHGIHPSSGWHWAELDRANGYVRPRDGNSNVLAPAILDALDPAILSALLDGLALGELPEEAMAYWYDNQGDAPVTWCVRLPSIQRNRKVYSGPTLHEAIASMGEDSSDG